jgi:CRISPR-associated protein (TIGR02710 family)
MPNPRKIAKLLICTVGGSKEPIVASIKHHAPEKVYFVTSQESDSQVEKDSQSILSMLEEQGYSLRRGQFDTFQVASAVEFDSCVKEIRKLELDVTTWQSRSYADTEFAVVVDFTGGTKCMSAALALVARRWPCLFSYVSGRERTKNGMGVVIPGTEQLVHVVNPWQQLGYQSLEDLVVLFDRGNYAAAAKIAEEAGLRSDEPLKRELFTISQWVKIYENWDRFDHSSALAEARRVQKNFNDLRHAMPQQADGLEASLTEAVSLLTELKNQKKSCIWINDLLGNASRRAMQGRHDDAVARLYRAIEASAQIRVRDHHRLPDNGRIPLSFLPMALQEKWKGMEQSGEVRLGAQDHYALLKELGDELGQRFFELGLHEKESPLSLRNSSILAHGFDPMGESDFKRLWAATLKLLMIAEDRIVQFPCLQL